MPGGFHPFHAGHYALYKSAVDAFPDADVYVAATNDTSARPFPFAIKEKLAKLAGVAPNRFVQVKSPFKAEEVTARYNPEQDTLIFVRSDKDRGSPPRPGGVKKDGSPSYLQPWTGKNVEPFAQHAYMAYLPTVEFGPGMTSATEIRGAWPRLNDKRKQALVMSLYPRTQANPKLAATVVKLLDTAMGTELNEFAPSSGDGGDEKSYLLQLADDLGNALYGPNKNKQEIENIMGKIRAAGGDVKISWNNDSTMNVVMYHPVHFKQGYLIRLVGRGDQGVAEGSLEELTNTSLKVKEPKNFVNVNDRNQVIYKVMKFKSGKDTYLINFTVKGAPAYGKKQNWNAVNVSFGVRDEQDDYSFGDEINTDLTARNKNQFLIYSTVINAVRKFITEYNTEIDEIIMQGAGERQAVMYQRFFQSAGKYFPGWHYDGKHSLVRDVPRQPAKKVQEQGVAENQGWAATLEESTGQVLDLTKNFSNHQRVHAEVVDVLPSGKVKLRVVVADAVPGKKPTVAVGQALSMAVNYLRRAPRVTEAENIKVEPVAKSLRIQNTQTQPKQNVYVAPDKKKTPAVVNHIKTKDQPTNEDYIDEKWSDKYKQSINCDRPQGFSQRAHCAGRKK